MDTRVAPPRNIHVGAAASPRAVSCGHPRYLSPRYQTVASDLADQALCQALGPGALDGSEDVLDPAPSGQSLPLAKVYARLFNGDLKILSMEGHGTDCYVYISRVEGDNELPT